MSDDDEPTEKKAPIKAPENIYDSKMFLTMENVLEKMKLMNYERAFCVPKHIAPFARTAFALPAKNPSVQFQNFLSLVEWLCEEATGDRGTFSVDKFDDPNTSVNKMMLSLRNLGFALDFPVSKLKLGHGEAICNVLDFLCDKVLSSRGFSYSTPIHEEPAEVEDAEVDEDADLGDIVDETEAMEDEEEAIFGNDKNSLDGDDSFNDSFNNESHQMIENTIDPLLWKTELERVGPRLKSSTQSLGSKEWRAHIEQTKQHEKTIQTILPSAQGHMKSISLQIKEAVEKMRGKELSINNQFEHIRQEYEQLTTSMKTLDESQSNSRSRVTLLTNNMSSIQEQLDELKEDMAGRENSATDTSPLVNIKQALVSIKGDVQQFDLQIGVVGHTLMQAKLKNLKQREGGRKGKAGRRGHGGDAKDDDLDDDDDDDGEVFGRY
jgi:estrogen-related receptor beta like 1